MRYSIVPVRVTRVMTRILMAILVVCSFLVPFMLNWYAEFRSLTVSGWWILCVTYYICAVIAAPALILVDRLLSNILKEQVFTTGNVQLLRWIRWCCGLISLLCIAPGFAYKPLFLMVLMMGFLSFILNVVVQVMKAAVSIREENELTI